MTVDPAIAVGASAAAPGQDREFAFYPTIVSVAVIASYYALFAVMGGSGATLAQEAGPIVLFLVLAALGFRRSLWFVVAALLLHGGFDAIHAHLITNPGVPVWWPGFCLAYDGIAASLLAAVLIRRRMQPSAVSAAMWAQALERFA